MICWWPKMLPQSCPRCEISQISLSNPLLQFAFWKPYCYDRNPPKCKLWMALHVCRWNLTGNCAQTSVGLKILWIKWEYYSLKKPPSTWARLAWPRWMENRQVRKPSQWISTILHRDRQTFWKQSMTCIVNFRQESCRKILIPWRNLPVQYSK